MELNEESNQQIMFRNDFDTNAINLSSVFSSTPGTDSIRSQTEDEDENEQDNCNMSDNDNNDVTTEDNSTTDNQIVDANERGSNETISRNLITDNSSNVQSFSNGIIKPVSGKPMNFAFNSKYNKNRGRPKRKALIPMYQSQITDNKIGIKLKLKKATIMTTTTTASTVSTSSSKRRSKSARKRSRKFKQRDDETDSDDSDYYRRKRKINNNLVEKNDNEFIEPSEQSGWGLTLPEHILIKIFQLVVNQDGCFPALLTIGKVCCLWRELSNTPSLWRTVDLSNFDKEKNRTELRLKWIIENKLLSSCKDVNLGNWRVTNCACVLDILYESCPNITSITLLGWKQLTTDNLMYIVNNFKSLQRIDLSATNMETSTNKTAVYSHSLSSAIMNMNERLTHLSLAQNRLSGIPQLVQALSKYCPNLILLDLSNVNTVAVSHGILNIEMLQKGCQKLKVLRITNSHIVLNTATLDEQEESPGFPNLEELSIAALVDESRLMNNEYFLRILKNSTKLKLLDVRGCSRLTHDSLIRLRAWDIKHLFLSGCSITRDAGSGLELIASKWAHSLTELDLAWANVQASLDDALKAIAEKGPESPLNHLNLCGSSVSLDAVKAILTHCPLLNSINLASCRGLPRGVKRLLQGDNEIKELRENLGVTLKYPIKKN